MTQPNMRRLLKQPHISLREGGEVSPWSLRGIIQNVQSAVTPTPQTPEQAQRAKDLADYKARAEAERNAPKPVAPVTPAPVQAAAPVTAITDYSSGNATTMRMKAAGLRDGGDLKTGHGGNVPGTGEGDKIPAKYEPGEFVVSNDMLDAQPELREHLRGLRKEVLANKGMTPEQADAKALSGGTLRAANAAELATDWTARNLQGQRMTPVATPMQSMAESLGPRPAPVAAPEVPKYTPPSINQNTGAYSNEQIPRSAAGAQGGSAGRAAPAVNVAEGAAQAARPSLRAGLAAESSGVGKLAYGAGRALAPVAKVAGALGPIAVGADVVSHFNDYKINDPDVDSSNSGTMRALGKGDFAGAGRSFSKGALEAGMDLGSFAANTLDYVVPGKAPVSTAYGKMLRGAFGDQLQAAPGVAGGPAVPAAKPRAQAADMPAISGSFGGTAPAAAPSAPAVNPRTQSFAAGSPEAIAAGKQMDSGSLYIPGQGQGMMRNSKGDIVKFDTGAPVSQGAPARAYAPPDYSREDAIRNAPSLAVLPKQTRSLREERPSNMSFIEEVRYNAHRKQDDRSRGLDIQDDANRMNHAATLRGQDLNYGSNMRGHAIAARGQDVTSRGQDLSYDSSMYGHDLSARTARWQGARDQANKDRDFGAARADKYHEQDRQADDDWQKHALESSTTSGPDGKPMQNPAAAADYSRFATQHVQDLVQDKNTPEPIRALLQAKGLGGLDKADRSAIANAYRVKQIQDADHTGINPLGSSGDTSYHPRDYMFNGDASTVLQKRLRNNMGSVPVNALEYGPGRNRLLWNNGPADTTLIPPEYKR